MPAIFNLLDDLNQRCASVGSSCRFDVQVLHERARLSGLTPGGAESYNRTCRLLKARDGWLAVNLVRERDRECLSALLGREVTGDPWAELTAALPTFAGSDMLKSGRLLGFPIACVGTPAAQAGDALHPQYRIARVAPPGAARENWRVDPPLVIDMSALWAGPLCGHILAASGARVIKVESIGRPDSIRTTAPEFFDSLNADKDCIALDFDSAADQERLRALIGQADLVISSARPRAFDQLDLIPEVLLKARSGSSWVAITAYGWYGPDNNAVGFGDDVAAAAGLVEWSATGPQFSGDALADPLTGIGAAAAAIAAIRGGGGLLIDASLYASASYVANTN
jgi:CoA-transferase family III